MKTLGASIAIWNGHEHDFCFEACIESVLPICEHVVVAYIASEDGTVETLRDMARAEPKIQLVEYHKKEIPKADGLWVMDWTNFARERLSTDYNLQIDADEILHESAREKILERIQGPEVTLRCRRWNFWRDTRHLIPEGVCLGAEVLRVAPKRHWLPADVPIAQGQDAMNLDTAALDVEIFHYGFLRKPEAFFKKEKALQTAFTGGYDPKLEPAQKYDGNWMDMPGFAEWQDRLVEFNGVHPKYARQWLIERGYIP